MKPGFRFQCDAQFIRQTEYPPRAGVVPSCGVLLTGIAKADDELHWLIEKKKRSIKRKSPPEQTRLQRAHIKNKPRYYFFFPASFFPASFFSPSFETPSFFCTVVGISPAATMAAASSAATARGMTIVATGKLSPLASAGISTPSVSFRSLRSEAH